MIYDTTLLVVSAHFVSAFIGTCTQKYLNRGTFKRKGTRVGKVVVVSTIPHRKARKPGHKWYSAVQFGGFHLRKGGN
jgi:hypothetical protein